MPVSDRPTPDIVLLLLTMVICLSILLIGAGVFVLALLHADYDLTAAYAGFGNVIGLLIGAVLGYLAGKGRSPQSREQ